ncbi:MAG: 50S ribosomal protein L1 [Candidatus Heimdallarchaeota archaeon]|nr:MAG: 50S ribosomal protein L1 [Candidatus Heimdallarchaeota archaeon]
MSYSPNQLEEAISKAKISSTERKQRKFPETIEISIGLRDIDLKNPTNRINLETLVPNDLGGKSKVAVFAEGDLATKSKESGLTTLNRQEIERLATEPKNAKKLANEYSFFLAEPSLMPIVAKFLGKILGPRGKMPKPIPPRVEIDKFVERYNRTVTLRLKSSPVINTKIGKITQDNKTLAENANTILQALTTKLPKGIQQIRSIHFKTTMGPAVKV